MSIRIAVIGANPPNVAEIKNVVTTSLAGELEIITATVDHYRHLADLELSMVVCLVNRQEEMEAVFGSERVVSLEFVPPTEYFLTLCRIPAKTHVVIFNNSAAGTYVLMRHLQNYELMHLNYEVIAYDEMPPEEVGARLRNARVITGGISYVGKGSALFERFGQYLSPDTQVIASPLRIATSNSISQLCHKYSALQTQRIIQELKRIASIDYLTEIPNRRSFDETFRQEWNRARRDQTSLSIAMLDLDFFKNYNDHYGHKAGDQCLRAIAHTIRGCLHRPTDHCARYGGEEFAVILANTDSAGAMKVLENIRNAVLDLSIIHGFSSIASTITISIGYTTAIPSHIGSPEQTLKKADEALYLAKFRGRNQTVFSSIFGNGDL